MGLKATTALACSVAAVCLGGRIDRTAPSAPMVRLDREISTEALDTTEIERRLLDHAWVDAAEGALEQPTVVELPYAEWGGFLGSEPDARGFAFSGSEGQVVKVALERPEMNETSVFVDGDVRVELFLVQARSGQLSHVRLAELSAGESALWFRLPIGASYVVRLQPEPLTDALYRLSVELEAALPFPVKGGAEDAVGSLFGMARDAGARHHEGIDIFAPRLTPVTAVADGRATPRENKLGGNTVWLSTPGTSYYYAHLERVAVGSGQRVRVGDVIGYVGNSGNAGTTEPHLHFGIYRWGKGAVDPFPLLQARRFAEPPAGFTGSQLVQASQRRTCASAPRVRRVAAYGCAMRIENTTVEGLAAAAASDCLMRDLTLATAATDSERPSTFRWEAAAPLSVDAPSARIVPVGFDPAGAVFEMPEPHGVDSSLLECELASATKSATMAATPLHAGTPRLSSVMMF
jgi:hypothetical protein